MKTKSDKIYFRQTQLLKKWNSMYVKFIYREYEDIEYDSKKKMIDNYKQKLNKISLKDLEKINLKNYLQYHLF